MQAATAAAVTSRARSSGEFVCGGTVRERRRWWNDPRHIRLRTREIIRVFQQLELQLGAGVLSDEAIGSMMETEPSRRTRLVLREIHAGITTGRMSISEAFGLFPRSFPPALLTVIRAGERAGASELGKRFGDLRQRLEFLRSVRGITVRAFQYPVLIGLLAAAFVSFVITFLVPVLARVLETVNAQLPPLTQALVEVSRYAGAHWGRLVSGGVLAVATVVLLRTWPPAALWLDRLVLRLPYVGGLYRSLACSLVFRTYASLYEAGEPAPDVLELCAGLVRNRAMRAAIADVRRHVLQGDPLHVAFRRTGCFPLDACAMVRTGESAGLGASMRLSAEHHATYARERIGGAVAWLEPIAILAMGAFVGLVAYAFFTPILSIYEGIR
jgi:type II secretory pathway component PulF